MRSVAAILVVALLSTPAASGCGSIVTVASTDAAADLAPAPDVGLGRDGSSDAGPATDHTINGDTSVVDATLVVDRLPSLDSIPAGVCPVGMAFVPPGTFVMGDSKFASGAAQPPHLVTLTRAFCMDRTEVTVDAYQLCVGHGCAVPRIYPNCNWMAGRGNHPMNCVDWGESRTYCQFRGGDLPTEAQWEFAARGTDGRTYPWGDEEPGTQACWNRYPTPGSTCPVAAYPATLHGLFDLAGNTDEWTLDWYAAYTPDEASDPVGPDSGTRHTTRGGGWGHSNRALLRSAFRRATNPTYLHPEVGFRCVHSPL